MSESTTVAVLYPTRGRAAQARKRLSDLLSQALPDGVRLVVVAAVEKGDKETKEALGDLEGVMLVSRKADTTSVYGWNQAYAAARDFADWVVLGADDVVWKEGWLQKALDVAKESGAALVGLLDGHDKSRRYGPHYMARVDWLEEHMGGVMAVPHYQSWSFDYEACERADRMGLYAPSPGPVIDHLHPDWKLAEMDDTYEKAWPSHAADRTLRDRRRAQGYPTDYEPAKLEDALQKEKKMLEAPENKMLPAVEATDAAEKLAKKHGLDLRQIEGTGAGGRIILSDVEAAVAAAEEEE